MPSTTQQFKPRRYDVALSFAGENRHYVQQVARELKAREIKVFYDAYEEATLWGKNLYTHLRDVYQNQAWFTVLFISKEYAAKVWTNHERESVQAQAFGENQECLLPARSDDTEVPGILPTIGYIDLRKKSPNELCDLIVEKLQLRLSYLVSFDSAGNECSTMLARGSGQMARPPVVGTTLPSLRGVAIIAAITSVGVGFAFALWRSEARFNVYEHVALFLCVFCVLAGAANVAKRLGRK